MLTGHQQDQNDCEHKNNFKKKDLKLKLANTVYVCQCQKNFLSFPAIYSHARNKHNIKLTSKVRSNGFKRQFDGIQEKIYFKWSKNKQNQQRLKIQQEEIIKKKNIVNDATNFKFIRKIRKIYNQKGEINIYGATIKYLDFCTSNRPQHTFLEISNTFLLFTQCINSHYMIVDQRQIHQNYCEDTHPQNIPYFLNFFLIWYLPSNLHKHTSVSKAIDIVIICQILQQFCRWLRMQGYILLDCFINQDFVCNEKSTFSKEVENIIKIQ